MIAAPLERIEEVMASLVGGVPIPKQDGMPIERAEAAAASLGFEARITTPAPDELCWLLARALRSGPVLVIDSRAGVVTGLKRRARTPRQTLASWPNGERSELDPATRTLLAGLAPRRQARAVEALARQRDRAAVPTLAVVQLTPRGEGPLRRTVARLASAVGADAADVAMAIAGWWLLGALAFRGTDGGGWLLGWGLLLVLRVVVGTGAAWTRAVAFQRLAEKWRRRVLDGLLDHRRPRIEDGALAGGLAEIEHVEEAGHDAALGGALGTIEFLAAATVVAFGAAPLGGWMAMGLAAVILLAAVPGLVRATEDWSIGRVAVTRRMLDLLSGHRTRLVFGDSEPMRQREEEALDRYARAAQGVDRMALFVTIVPVRVLLVVGLLGLLPATLAGVPAAQVAVAIGGLLLAGSAVGRLGGAASAFADARAALRRLGALVDIPTDPARPRPETVPVLVPARPVGRLELEIGGDQARTTVAVARGARVQCGAALESLGWVGQAARQGAVGSPRSPRLDGVPRELIGQAAWTRRVGLIRGEDTIFAGTLAWNLLAGCRWPPGPADLERAEAICRAFELDAVALTDEGLSLRIGEGGRGVSEGERARIVLARAVLRDPDFLVLCDPLEMLDPPLRTAVAAQLESMSGAVLVGIRD